MQIAGRPGIVSAGGIRGSECGLRLSIPRSACDYFKVIEGMGTGRIGAQGDEGSRPDAGSVPADSTNFMFRFGKLESPNSRCTPFALYGTRADAWVLDTSISAPRRF